MTIQAGTITGGWKIAQTMGATSVATPMNGAPLPCTVYLNSSDATRKIEYSVDGTTYYTAAYDASTASQLVTKVMGQISHIRFTGLTTDTWGIL